MDATENQAPEANPPFARYKDVNGIVHEVGSILAHPKFRGFVTAVRRIDGKLLTMESNRLTFPSSKS